MNDTDPREIPSCRADFLAAAVQLRNDSGLTAGDIAVILKLTRNAVLDLLHEHDTGAQRFGTNSYTRPERSGP